MGFLPAARLDSVPFSTTDYAVDCLFRKKVRTSGILESGASTRFEVSTVRIRWTSSYVMGAAMSSSTGSRIKGRHSAVAGRRAQRAADP